MWVPSALHSRWRPLADRFVAGVRRHGLLRAIPLAAQRAGQAVGRRIRVRWHRATYERRLRSLQTRIQHAPRFIDLFHVPMGWHTPLFQRFQHMSVQAVRLGGLALYGAHPLVDRDILVYEEVEPGLLIFDAMDSRVRAAVIDAVTSAAVPKVLRLQSIDLATTPAEVEDLIRRGMTIVYEYIDELTEHITGTIPDFVFERHRQLLADPRVFVIATADKLFAEVRRARSRDCLLSTNGVDIEVWRVGTSTPPADLEPIVATGRPIVAYHGAIARWIDPDLISAAARTDEFELVLIGYEHDRELRARGILDLPRVHFLGAKPYAELPRYARFYDVAILPFAVNEITESVSPVKIFEYMAAGKPVVTTGLPECRKYRSCLIADTPDEFVKQLRRALELRRDPAYLETLRADAESNAWIEKARAVYRAVGVLQ